ncbi:hypothetical protein [Paenibacillus glacialis]|uniref:hypothetical protein n=1 Tax=Paenibacillus glacialis TaxID=494026 RepID=UPI000837FFF1|nr:hypothetical protein [Paenibacillus glacialis]
MSQLIVNYTITRLIDTGQFQFENKTISLDIECITDDFDDLHEDVVTAICLKVKVKSEQLKITGIMKVE